MKTQLRGILFPYSSREIGLVKHVGPPSALSEISLPLYVTTSQPASSSRRLVIGFPSNIRHLRGASASTLVPIVGNSSSGITISLNLRRCNSCQKGTAISGG